MIKRRIVQLIEYKGLPKEKFYTELGVTSAAFRGKQLESSLNSNAIESLISLIPDVNLEWLITGSGPMLNSEPKTAIQRAADDFANETKRIERIGRKILGTVEEQPSPVSTNDNRLWSMIESQQRQLESQQEAIKTQSRIIEALSEKLGNDAPRYVAKAGE